MKAYAAQSRLEWLSKISLLFLTFVCNVCFFAQMVQAESGQSGSSVTSAPSDSVPADTPGPNRPRRVIQRKVLIMPFAGPYEVDIATGTGLAGGTVYGLQSKLISPLKSEYMKLPAQLEVALEQVLKVRYGKAAVSRWSESCAVAPVASDDSVFNATKSANAAYVLSGEFETVKFEGKVVPGPWYQVRLNAKLRNTASGAIVWQIQKHNFDSFAPPSKNQESPQALEEVLFPAMVKSISSAVIEAIRLKK